MSSDQLIERWCKDHATRMCRERRIIKEI